MADLSNLLLLLVILLNFFALGSSRLAACIHAVALQGGILALLPLTAHGFSGHALLLAGGALALKAVLIPWLLLRAMRKVRIRREVEPLIGYVPTLLTGALATAAAFIFADLLPLVAAHQGGLFIPTSLATLLTGFLLLISRRKALTQVVGYLILENGIFNVASGFVLTNNAGTLSLNGGSLAGTLGGRTLSGALPRWRPTLRVGYGWRSFEAFARLNHVDGMRDAEYREFRVPSATYVDVGFSADLAGAQEAGWSLEAGIENVGDQMPPLFPSQQQANTDPSRYDVIGRRLRLGASYRF